MISYIKGKILQKTDKRFLVISNCIGYQIYAPEYLLIQAKVGDELELYTHSHFSTRDETANIFGFTKPEELELFEQLINISGVGRKSALAALSIARVEELKKTISRGEPALLQKVAGIGRKTAERIVIELKDKMEFDSPGGTGAPLSGSDGEVIQALEQLGYNAADIREILRDLPADLETSEEKIKTSLQRLGKN